MIKASELKAPEAPKIDVEAELLKIEKDIKAGKLDVDGRHYDYSYDTIGVNKLKKALHDAGYEALSDLTGYRGGIRQITLLVSMRRI